ncbi:MAG: hypothetical protein WCG85_05395 [Polyangia bacterium]
MAAVSVIVALPSRATFAGSHSSLVFVSVEVVQSCRIDAIGGQTGNGVDLKMLCNSAAKPNVGLSGQSTAAPAPLSTTVTGVRSVSTVSLTPTAAGTDQQMLRIDF